MTEAVADQAAGLRRLMAAERVRSVGLVSPAAAPVHVRVAAGLAQALAALDERPLIIDESPDSAGLAQALGLAAGPDLGALARAGSALSAAVQTAGGLRLVRAARAGAALGHLTPDGCARFVDAFMAAVSPVSCVLVQARAGDGPEALACAAAAQDILVMLTARPDDVQGAYALMKTMALRHERRRFRVMFTQVDDAAGARRLYGNMAAAAGRYLDVELEYAGCYERAAFASGHAAARRYLQHARAMAAWPLPPDETAGTRAFLHRMVESCRQALRSNEGAGHV